MRGDDTPRARKRPERGARPKRCFTRLATLVSVAFVAATLACTNVGVSANTPRLPEGAGCTSSATCASGTCVDGVCCAGTTCDHKPAPGFVPAPNEVGSETETACGGTTSTKCDVGKGCSSSADCASGFCNTTTHLCSSPCTLEIATGGYHTCARKADGSVWCWGGNEYGQVEGANVRVGDGVRENTVKPSPVQTTALATSAVEITAGYTHSCARKGDGSVWCWGGWTFDATPGPPVELKALGRSVVEIADTCVRKSDGSIWCWGSNKSAPVQVAALGTSAVEIAGTCARKDDGSVWCWKRTLDGVVGDAVEVTALGAGAVEIATGAEHTCARKGDGSVWCWGWNERGQLGDGTTTLRTSPVPVTALGTSAIEVGAGGDHTCARKNDGSVWCWGWNDWGQLGDGTTMNRSTPGPTVLGCETLPSKAEPSVER